MDVSKWPKCWEMCFPTSGLYYIIGEAILRRPRVTKTDWSDDFCLLNPNYVAMNFRGLATPSFICARHSQNRPVKTEQTFTIGHLQQPIKAPFHIELLSIIVYFHSTDEHFLPIAVLSKLLFYAQRIKRQIKCVRYEMGQLWCFMLKGIH